MNSMSQNPQTGEWVRSEDAPPINDPAVLGWTMCLASIRYYENDSSDWSDAMYDGVSLVVVSKFNKLPDELKEIFGSPEELRSTGYHIQLTPHQRKIAKAVELLSDPLAKWDDKFLAVELANNPDMGAAL